MQEKKCRDLSFGWKMNKSLQIIVVNFLRGHLKKKFPGDTLKKKIPWRQISLLSSINTSKPEGNICVNIYTHYEHLFDISLVYNT